MFIIMFRKRGEIKMLKIRDVVQIDNKYETVSFVKENNREQFEIIGRNEHAYLCVEDIDKDENGNPIILRYGEEVEVSNTKGFYINDVKKFMFYDDGLFWFKDGSNYKYARPIQKEKKLEPEPVFIEDVHISIKNINKRLGDIEYRLNKVIYSGINNLAKRLEVLEG